MPAQCASGKERKGKERKERVSAFALREAVDLLHLHRPDVICFNVSLRTWSGLVVVHVVVDMAVHDALDAKKQHLQSILSASFRQKYT